MQGRPHYLYPTKLKSAHYTVSFCSVTSVWDVQKRAAEDCGALLSAPQGYSCEATDEELARYMNYPLRGLCPDDWFFVQHLIFVRNCYSLPKRRCLSRTPQQLVEVRRCHHG